MNRPRLAAAVLAFVLTACSSGEKATDRAGEVALASGGTAGASAGATAAVTPPIDSVRDSSAAGGSTAADTTGPRNDSTRFAPVWAKVKYPPVLPGSILPARRIVAYYGNPHSKRMGILGEIPSDQMMARLDAQAKEWERADPGRPVLRMLELVAIVAQADSGKDGLYRRREAAHIIDRVHGWAKSRGWHFMVDIQNGHSNYLAEMQYLLPWLQKPDVHLALDPEFDMVGKTPPGRKIGTTDAADVNAVIRALGDLVTKHNLPPKVLVVHRFTRGMLTNVENIKLDPRVQVVIDMDGWGAPFLKRATYRQFVAPFPVQYTGFKLFYNNDTKKGHPLMKPADVLKLYPKPVFIMYQ
jgi:hypothetical protein